MAAGDLVFAKALGLDLTKSDLRLSKEKSCLGGGSRSRSSSSGIGFLGEANAEDDSLLLPLLGEGVVFVGGVRTARQEGGGGSMQPPPPVVTSWSSGCSSCCGRVVQSAWL